MDSDNMVPCRNPGIDEILDDLFTYHPPTEEKKAKYDKVNEATPLT